MFKCQPAPEPYERSFSYHYTAPDYFSKSKEIDEKNVKSHNMSRCKEDKCILELIDMPSNHAYNAGDTNVSDFTRHVRRGCQIYDYLRRLVIFHRQFADLIFFSSQSMTFLAIEIDSNNLQNWSLQSKKTNLQKNSPRLGIKPRSFAGQAEILIHYTTEDGNLMNSAWSLRFVLFSRFA